MKRLAIISTHPIQYNAPLFRLLAQEQDIKLKVFYTWSQAEKKIPDPEFKQNIAWDIDLLSGYNYEFIKNTARNPSNRSFFGIQNPSLKRKLNEFFPNAILIYGWNFFSHLQIMRYFKGKIPVFFRGDSTLLDEKKSLKTILRRVSLTWIFSNINYALYVGTNNKHYYEKHGLKSHQLIFAPHAIDNNRFMLNTHRQKASKWRKELGVSENETIILFAGKLTEKKNPEILINAFEKLSTETANAHLVFVGDGELKIKLKTIAKDNKRILFIPFQNQMQMPVVYHFGDIFVLPSKGPGETWGLAINEAMACGLPIIASNKCGAAIDLIYDNQNGFVFQSDNIDALYEKLTLLTLDKTMQIKFGKKSKELIRKWNYEKTIERIKQIINK